jgi:hypothetical protein
MLSRPLTVADVQFELLIYTKTIIWVVVVKIVIVVGYITTYAISVYHH